MPHSLFYMSWWTIKQAPALFALILFGCFSSALGIIAMLMPLKIIILLGSESIPIYFPLWFHQFDKTFLAEFLALITVICFFVHLALDRAILFIIDKAALTVYMKNKGLVLYSGEEISVKWLFRIVTRIFTSLLFSLILYMVVFWLYPAVAGVLITLVFFVLCLFYVIFKIRYCSFLMLDERSKVITSFGSLVFISCFCFLVIDSLYFDYSDFYTSIIALILCRHIASQLFRSFNDFRHIYFKGEKAFLALGATKIKIDYRPSTNDLLPNILKVLSSSEKSLRQLTLEDIEVFESGVTGVQAFKVTTDALNVDRCMLLAKCYKGKSIVQLENEVTFLRGVGCSQFPAIHSQHEMLGFKVLVLLISYDKMPKLNFASATRVSYLTWLQAMAPSDKLVKIYFNSHQLLSRRFDDFIREAAPYLISESDDFSVQELSVVSNCLLNLEAKLPRCYWNPDVKKQSIYIVDSSGQVFNWGRWSVGILGEHWPILERDFELYLDSYRNELKRLGRPFIYNSEEIRVIALVSELLKQFSIKNMVSILDCLKELKDLSVVLNN